MKEALLEILECPVCEGHAFALAVTARDEREIRAGALTCRACAATLAIENGIVDAFLNPPPQIVAEAEGWVRLLDTPENRHEFQDAWIQALPFIRPEQTPAQGTVEAWHRLGRHFMAQLDSFDWRGKRVLEVGAGRCWGVAELARRGADVVGLDILTHKYLGLETADVWFAAEELYFERVRGDMHRLPFRPGAFDAVVTTASLHHTERLHLALREIVRALDDRGFALFINEPVLPDGHPPPDLSEMVEVQHGIIETQPRYGEWMAAFAAAGLQVKRMSLDEGLHVMLRKSLAYFDGRASAAYGARYGRTSRGRLRDAVLYGQTYLAYAADWLVEKARRAPSAPGYYWRQLRNAAGR